MKYWSPLDPPELELELLEELELELLDDELELLEELELELLDEELELELLEPPSTN